MRVDSKSLPVRFDVDHPAFGRVTFVFDDRYATGGYAATDGFIFFGVAYPRFDFVFEREGDAFVASEINRVTKQHVADYARTVFEIAPPAFRSFVLSKAKELANALKPAVHRDPTG